MATSNAKVPIGLLLVYLRFDVELDGFETLGLMRFASRPASILIYIWDFFVDELLRTRSSALPSGIHAPCLLLVIPSCLMMATAITRRENVRRGFTPRPHPCGGWEPDQVGVSKNALHHSSSQLPGMADTEHGRERA